MNNVVLTIDPLGTPWSTLDPFLFCVHHLDAYPAGNERMGPTASLAGRDLGQDFGGKDGWNMYHGDIVPGFPQHPHRGFETVTVVRQGFIDHSDSLGAAARFGAGDTQWLTAGKGVVHSEMFPLVRRDGPNPTELFQIWLNLPREGKMVEPDFTMYWRESMPRVTLRHAQGRATEVVVISGDLAGATAPAPPPRSWAARPDAHLLIASLKMAPHAEWTLPAAAPGLNRALYYFQGTGLRADTREVGVGHAIVLRSDALVPLANGPQESDLLLLQARPIGQPVVQYGPFVMNSEGEVRQAFLDFERTRFGGWPWESDGPVHPREQARFARHPDGRLEAPASNK
jgi:redox-sensitive bicupin YhaK (pirin superfamily)